MIDERPGYPADAVQWHVSADNRNYASAVFQWHVARYRFSVLLHHKLAGFREKLRPDSIGGERIFWSELLEWRYLIVRHTDADALVMVEENEGDVTVTVAANDLEAARQTISDLSKALVLVPIGSDPALPIDFWYYGPEGPMTTTRKIDLRILGRNRVQLLCGYQGGSDRAGRGIQACEERRSFAALARRAGNGKDLCHPRAGVGVEEVVPLRMRYRSRTGLRQRELSDGSAHAPRRWRRERRKVESADRRRQR